MFDLKSNMLLTLYVFYSVSSNWWQVPYLQTVYFSFSTKRAPKSVHWMMTRDHSVPTPCRTTWGSTWVSVVLLCPTKNPFIAPQSSRPLSSEQVVDRCSRRGEFDDPSSVAKFELSDEQYAQRGESLRAFKKAHKLGQFSEDAIASQTSLEKARIARDQQWNVLAKAIHVGSRHCLAFDSSALVTSLLLDSMCLLQYV